MQPKIFSKSIFEDSRGFFIENFKKADFSEQFVQDNLSFSKNKGTVRGMHFQKGEFAQTKLVTVLKGSILDVVMNMQTKEVYSFELCSKKMDSLLVPNDFVHGFMTLENDTLASYKVDNYYNKEMKALLIGKMKFFKEYGRNSKSIFYQKR